VSEVRKLAAILVADVVGYSRLTGADEDRTLARLRGLRSDLIDPAITAHHGRIVKRTGDGSIIEFRSVVDAVRCAIEVQNGLIERNAGVPPERRIEFRVGIHLGDVVEESDGDLMGDGVNIAARLEGIAKPGAICLSEDAYRQVKQRLDLKVSDLGATQLKNIAEPIHVYSLEVGQPAQANQAAVGPSKVAAPEPKARGWLSRFGALAAALALVLIAAGTYAWHSGLATRLVGASAEDKLDNAPRLSIVVLPFENMSGDKEQDYFADGITDDLTTDLSHLFDSFVIARNTAMTYKGKPVDVKQIGRELGVRYALEGSVRRVGEAITVNAQLISTETGAHVWADRFESERARLGELQAEFVARLANTLGVELRKAETLRALRERRDNPDAVDLVMQGVAAFYRFNPAGMNEAVDNYERALKLDPNYTEAQIALSFALSTRAQNGWSTDRAADIDRADRLADQGLSARPDNALALWAKAYVLGAKRQWDAAILEAEKALDSDRNFAQVYGQVGMWRAFVGRSEDGFKDVETAIKLSPHDPARPFWDYHLCHLHSHLGQWDQAIPYCLKSIAGAPQFLYPHIDLTAAYGWLGRENEAKAALADLLKLQPNFTVQGFLSLVPLFSDNPVFTQQLDRLAEGLRKAGLPEGDKKTN
jgi:class 3 adenylate cyclase/TolB-like protein/Tfp pilus assembly protein PilF